MEQDFTVQEEYNLDRYAMLHDMLKSWHLAASVEAREMRANFGLEYDDEKLSRAKALEDARSAVVLNTREAPTTHYSISNEPSKNARVNRIRRLMQVGKPLGGYRDFYEKTLFRCVGQCHSRLGVDQKLDAGDGATDMRAMFYAMPIEPLQVPYEMFDDFGDSEDVDDPQSHPWAQTCQMRVSSDPDNRLETSTDSPEFADLEVTNELLKQTFGAADPENSGSSNMGKEWATDEYEQSAAARNAFHKQFEGMRIKDPDAGIRSGQLISNPGKHIWSKMAQKTNLFLRTSNASVSLFEAITEAYNTLLAAVMGITPPIYQLIITPFSDEAGDIQNLKDMEWDDAAGAFSWRLIVLSEAAMSGRDGPSDIENSHPLSSSSGSDANATHRHHINNAHTLFHARRAMSLQTRLAEFGFIQLDNKPGNCVIQRTYKTPLMVLSFSHRSIDVIDEDDTKKLVGDVLAIDFDHTYTMHVDTLNEDKEVEGYKKVFGPVGGDMYTLPVANGDFVIDAACVRFVNLMVYTMTLITSTTAEDQQRHRELQYMVAAMTRFTKMPKASKTTICQYFFHITDPEMLSQLDSNRDPLYLPHETHRDKKHWQGKDDSDSDRGVVQGPGYDLRKHEPGEEQVADDQPWDGDSYAFADFVEALRGAWGSNPWKWDSKKWEEFWTNIVGDIRERVHHYGLRYANMSASDAYNNAGKIMRALGDERAAAFLLKLKDLGDGNWARSANRVAANKRRAVLSFPLVVLALAAAGAELFRKNDTPANQLKPLPGVWPQQGNKKKRQAASSSDTS
jgi:hypothetical protein